MLTGWTPLDTEVKSLTIHLLKDRPGLPLETKRLHDVYSYGAGAGQLVRYLSDHRKMIF